MKVKISKKIYIILVTLAVLFIGCGRVSYPPEWGKRLQYKGSNLFYVSGIIEKQARKLGEYLVKNGFFQEGNRGTVQIAKQGDTYHFRMVVKEGMDKDMEFIKTAGIFAATMSRDVFEGKNVEMHLCDPQLKTLQVVGFKIKE